MEYLCDGCAVNEPWEHKCHSNSGQKDIVVRGDRVQAICSCSECQGDQKFEQIREKGILDERYS